MKIRKLEDHIKNKRQKLDVEKPDDHKIWSGIHKHFSENSSLRKRVVFWRAAAIIALLLSIGFVLVYEFGGKATDPQAGIGEADMIYHHRMYDQEIESKWQEVNSMQMDIEDFPWLMDELEEIEQVHLDYLKDLKNMGGQPEIKRAIENYYVQKIRLLDRLLIEIDKKQNYENRKDQNTLIY
ncbi:MAG: hypothetical protein U5Q03_19185 [Bacteroidota bacterium]|nr:hypothetical protein [Bacteroidota bacterium]